MRQCCPFPMLQPAMQHIEVREWMAGDAKDKGGTGGTKQHEIWTDIVQACERMSRGCNGHRRCRFEGKCIVGKWHSGLIHPSLMPEKCGGKNGLFNTAAETSLHTLFPSNQKYMTLGQEAKATDSSATALNGREKNRLDRTGKIGLW